MSHSRPYTIQWNRDELIIFNHKITVERFAQFLQKQLNELEDFVQSKVLFGIELEDIGITCDIDDSMDTGDITTPGLGPFLPEANHSLVNSDSTKFLRALTRS